MRKKQKKQKRLRELCKLAQQEEGPRKIPSADAPNTSAIG
jgi:hypothetical protein